jgi:hypothetical protein
MSAPSVDEPSLGEMLRIMDVCTALRRESEFVDQQFDSDKARAILREKLLHSAEVTGEQLSEEQVDIAIQWYYHNLHTFHEPPPTLSLTLARAYVHRNYWLSLAGAVFITVGSLWWLAASPGSPLSPTGHKHRQAIASAQRFEQVAKSLERHPLSPDESKQLQDLRRREAIGYQQNDAPEVDRLTSQVDVLSKTNSERRVLADRITKASSTIERMLRHVQAEAQQSDARDEAERLSKLAAVAVTNQDVDHLETVERDLQSLADTLDAQYTIDVVARPGEKSAVDRYYTDKAGKRVSGYYLIVEARDAAGRPQQLSIRNAETDKLQRVSRWAERVPQKVYERLKHDKQQDGVLNETAFAKKARGYLQPEIIMKDDAGQPLKREAQITEWAR